MMTILASRERFCLHPDIAVAPNKTEACEGATMVGHMDCSYLENAEASWYPQVGPVTSALISNEVSQHAQLLMHLICMSHVKQLGTLSKAGASCFSNCHRHHIDCSCSWVSKTLGELWCRVPSTCRHTSLVGGWRPLTLKSWWQKEKQGMHTLHT